MAGESFRRGQRVRLTDSLDMVRALAHPLFVTSMGRFLGESGVVDRVVDVGASRQHVVVSEFGSIWFDGRLLTVLPQGGTADDLRVRAAAGDEAEAERRAFAVLQAFVDAGLEPSGSATEALGRAASEAALAKGDLVRVISDATVLRQLAEASGDFDEKMLEHCGREGFVSHAARTCARVAGLGRHLFPAAALERLTRARDLVRLGDRVRLTQDLGVLHGLIGNGFDPRMQRFLGKLGVAVAVDMRAGLVQVRGLGLLWYPLRALTREPVALACRESNEARPHNMQQYQAPRGATACDECGLRMERGEWLFGCREHDFDLCRNCAAPRIVHPSDAAAPRRRSAAAFLSRAVRRLSGGGSRSTADSGPQLPAQLPAQHEPAQFSCYLSVGRRVDAQAVGMLVTEVSEASRGAVQLVHSNAAPRSAHELANAIVASRCVLVALTPELFHSARCLEELAVAVANGVPIVPVLLAAQRGAPALDMAAVRALAAAKPMDALFPSPQKDFWRKLAKDGAVEPDAALAAVRALPKGLPTDDGLALRFGPLRGSRGGGALASEEVRAQARRVAEAVAQASCLRRWSGGAETRIVSDDGAQLDFHVFASHNWGSAGSTHARVVPLVRALQLRGVRVWLDADNLRGSDNLSGKITEAQNASKYVLLAATREYVARTDAHPDDEFCSQEFQWARRNRRDRLLLVILEPDFRSRQSSAWGTRDFQRACGELMYTDFCEPASLGAAADYIAQTVLLE